MDLSIFDSVTHANEGAELVLLHPITQEETDVKIRLLGSDSDEYRALSKKRFEQMQRKAKMLKGKNKANEIDLDEAEEQAHDLLARMTVSWEGVEEDGQAVHCSVDNAKMIYGKYPTIREQVEKFIADRSNFIKG